MGRDKAMVLLRGKPLILYVYEEAKRVFTDIMVASSFHAAFDWMDARVVKDILPVPGSLTGIVSALIASDTDYVFVLGCDMPFVSTKAMRYVAEQTTGEDIIMPRTQGGFEPMHALYRRSCISAMLTAVGRGGMKIADLFALLPTRVLSPDPVFLNRGVSVFTNINTERNLRRAERLMRQSRDRTVARVGLQQKWSRPENNSLSPPGRRGFARRRSPYFPSQSGDKKKGRRQGGRLLSKGRAAPNKVPLHRKTFKL